MNITSETRSKIIRLAANYFANWKIAAAEHDYDYERIYAERYEAASSMTVLLGIETSEIETFAYRMYGNEIKSAYESSNATW